jgi:uncharacterized protein (TIGR03067 family)
MMLRLCVVFAVMLSFGVAGRCDDADALQGKWLPSEGERAGKPFPAQNITLEIKDGKYTVMAGGVSDKGTIKINASAKPKEMDITGTDGPNKGKTFKVIYELDGDTLKICYDLSGNGRPTEFKTKEGSKDLLVIYKREKP